MMPLQGVRALFIPDAVEPTKIVNLPHPSTGVLHNYVLCKSNLYELREMDGDNPHDKANYMRPLTKKDNCPVRSLILEGPGKEGVIVEEGSLIVSTKYNLAFTLISYFTRESLKGKEFTRFQSGEDLFDSMQEGIEGLSDLPEDLVKQSLVHICESVTEGDEDFYKYSEPKCLEFLKEKVHVVSQNFPKSIQESIVDPLLYPVDLDDITPTDVTSLALQRYSIYLLSSYLPDYWSEKLRVSADLAALDDYISGLLMKKAEKKAAEESLADMNRLNAENKRASDTQQGNGGSVKKKAAPVKKQAPKVSRGPLDMFMKRK